MKVCDYCGEKLGFFQGRKIYPAADGVSFGYICDKCSKFEEIQNERFMKEEKKLIDAGRLEYKNKRDAKSVGGEE